MIQIRRGKTDSWKKSKLKLAAGQPGYDKDRHKLKIGDGISLWEDLPDASGLTLDEVFCDEPTAKIKLNKNADSTAVITYGTAAPNNKTVGKVYLQYYEDKAEADFVVSFGVDGIWSYQIWNSGRATCTGVLPLTTTVQSAVGNGCLFTNEVAMQKVDYPFTFSEAPTEQATLVSAKNKVAWLASREPNSSTKSGAYNIISYNKQQIATYGIALTATGYVKQ